MTIFHKIASLLLLPAMLLSFAGASLHLHVCGHTGVIYSDIHFTDKPHVDHSKSCCNHEKESHHNCAISCDLPGDKQDGSCCLDFQKKIVTDKDYNPSFKSIKISPAVLDLAGTIYSGITGFASLTESCPPDFSTTWLPPPFQSRTVLIL